MMRSPASGSERRGAEDTAAAAREPRRSWRCCRTANARAVTAAAATPPAATLEDVEPIAVRVCGEEHATRLV